MNRPPAGACFPGPAGAALSKVSEPDLRTRLGLFLATTARETEDAEFVLTGLREAFRASGRIDLLLLLLEFPRHFAFRREMNGALRASPILKQVPLPRRSSGSVGVPRGTMPRTGVKEGGEDGSRGSRRHREDSVRGVA